MTGELIKNWPKSLSGLLAELASELDGIVDMGMTVCLVGEEKMAGRHGYLQRTETAIRDLVRSIVALLDVRSSDPGSPRTAARSQLIAGSEACLGAFVALQNFRNLPVESLPSTIASFATGWETVHQS